MKLIKCKLCGGRARFRYVMPFSWVECGKCKCHTEPFMDYYEQQEGKFDAMKAWNNWKVSISESDMNTVKEILIEGKDYKRTF